MKKAQMMMGNRTKFLVIGIIIAILGFVLLMNLLPFELPIDLNQPVFELIGFGLTIPMILVLLGVVLMGISRVFSY